MSMKRGCVNCPSKAYPGASRSRGQIPPPPSTRCPSRSRENSPLPPQYFPTTPGETQYWPLMRPSFPQEVQQFQYNEDFFDPSRPSMQSRNLVTGARGSISLSRKSQPRMAVQQPIGEYPPSAIPIPCPGLASVRPPQRVQPTVGSGIPQRIPTPQASWAPTNPQVRPTGAIRKVPGVAVRVPVRTPETPSIQRSQPRRQRPATASALQPVVRPTGAVRKVPDVAMRVPERTPGTPCIQRSQPQRQRPTTTSALPPVARQPVSRPPSSDRSRARMPARSRYDSDEPQELEEALKRDAIADLQANRVQVLRVQASCRRKVTDIPGAKHLDVAALNGSYAPPQASEGGYPTSIREVLNRQRKRAQANWCSDSCCPSPLSSQPAPYSSTSPRGAFPPPDLLNDAFIEDETCDFPPSPRPNVSRSFPACPNLNYGFIEDETMNFPPSPGPSYSSSFPTRHDLNTGFIEDETMNFPPSPGPTYSSSFPTRNDLNTGFIEDETMDFPQSPDLNRGCVEDDGMDLNTAFIEDGNKDYPPGPDLNTAFIEDEGTGIPPSPRLNQAFIDDGSRTSKYPGGQYSAKNMSRCHPNCSGPSR